MIKLINISGGLNHFRALPPVSVVQLSGRRHLQDVADICVEHVEQNVVLVTIQLYRCKLFSYRRVCEVPAQNVNVTPWING